MAELLMVNPKPRKRRKASKKRKSPRRKRGTTVTVRSNPRKRISRRRNPARRGLAMGDILNTQIIPAITAAGGALGLDVIWGMAPIPMNLKTGPLKHLVKGAGAIGLGMLAGMVTTKATAKQLTTGALTVVMHSAMTETVQRFAPQINLGAYEDNGMDAYMMGEYMQDSTNDLGYASAGFDAGEFDEGNDGMGLSIEDETAVDYEL